MRDLISGEASPLEQAAAKEAARLLRAALRSLPDRQRHVIVLVYVEDRSLTEIAAGWRISVAAVSQAHGRALRRLRAALETAGVGHVHEVL